MANDNVTPIDRRCRPRNYARTRPVDNVVVPIRHRVASPVKKDPFPPDAAQALALLEKAKILLDGLVERGEVGEGTSLDSTRWYLDDAIGMLRPFEEGDDD